MTGLNHTKAGSDPIALEDGDYPAWLWTLTETTKLGAGTSKAKPKSAEPSVEEALRDMRKQGKAGIKARNSLRG